MTYKETLNNLDTIESMIANVLGGYPYTEEEELLLIALDKVRDAIERQIAKAPTNITYDYGDLDYWNCPNCGIQQYAYETDELCRREVRNRCSHCGQLIDVGVMFNV